MKTSNRKNLQKRLKYVSLGLIGLLMSLGLSTTSCTPEKAPAVEGVTQIQVPDFPPTLEEGAVLHYSDLYDDVRYVILENHSDVRLSPWGITRMEILPHQEILLFDRDNKAVVRYDSLGHYLNHIGCVGGSRAEYAAPEDVIYDPHSNQVVVFDQPGYLYYYALDGKFIDKVKVPWFDGQLSSWGPDTLLIYTRFTDAIGPDGVGYNYCLFNRKGEVLAHLDPYGPDQLYKQTGFEESIVMNYQEGKVYLREFYGSVLYEVRPDTILPVYQLVIPEANTPYFESYRKFNKEQEKRVKDYLKQQEKETGEKSTYNPLPEVMRCTNFYRVGNRYFFILRETREFYGVYDADTQTCNLYISFVNDIFGSSHFCFSHVVDGYVYHLYQGAERMMGDDDDEEDEGLTPEQKELKHQIEDNYVIQICRFKQKS